MNMQDTADGPQLTWLIFDLTFSPSGTKWRSIGTGTDWSETRELPLTNNEPLCVGELLEEFPKVLIALLVCRAQHLR